MRIKELDLRNISSSCTSHPVIRLMGTLESLAGENVDRIKILFREEDIPRGIMEFILKKRGYLLEEEGKLEDGSLFFVARVAR